MHAATGAGASTPASPLSDIPFREIWCVDFEFQAIDGERPWVLCMVAREARSGREIRMWRDELLARQRAPFDTGADVVLVAYYASAEIGCFLELGWPLPVNVLDLYAEHRVETNGIPTGFSNRLPGALAYRGLGHLDVDEKQAMIDFILSKRAFSAAEQKDILDYCASDVVGLEALLPKMSPRIDWRRALLRGRYMAAAAHMERTGVPLDAELHQQLVENWSRIKQRLVSETDADYGVYEGQTFKSDRFERYLAARGIPWPRLPSGALDLKRDTFRGQAAGRPELHPLYELRTTLSEMRLSDLTVGEDGRNRYLLSAYATSSGRNAPSASKSIFGPARWLRGLIRPPPDHAIAYVDWSCQEIGIAAALSGDERMIAGYLGGDPYLAFAMDAGLAPRHATKASHAAIRAMCKSIVLGIGYGMESETMSVRAGITKARAAELLALHHATYQPFWEYSDNVVTTAILTGEIHTVLGWRRRIGRDLNPRSLRNFPMQGNGAEMMRIAAIAATDAGIEVCAPVHDVFLICAPIDRIDADVAQMREFMSRAGETITDGLKIRTSAEIVRAPDRYMDERGARMWDTVMRLLQEGERKVAA
jgi:DNA polymerase-1